MHVPDALIDTLYRRGRTLIVEIAPRAAKNRAWVFLYMNEDVRFGRNRLKKPDSPLYSVFRCEVPITVLEDDWAHDSDYFEHTERFETQDIAEAFEKAAEHEPDWSKWGTRQDHFDAP